VNSNKLLEEGPCNRSKHYCRGYFNVCYLRRIIKTSR